VTEIHFVDVQPCGNASCSRCKAGIRTRPHPEKPYSISCWLMLAPACGLSATNHKSCLLVALKRDHRNCYWVVQNECCIIEPSGILIVIDVVCEVGKSVETPRNMIL
jgi:hypothetical protein